MQKYKNQMKDKHLLKCKVHKAFVPLYRWAFAPLYILSIFTKKIK